MKKIKFVGLFYSGSDYQPAREEIVGVLAASGLAVAPVVGKNINGGDLRAWNISHIVTGYKMFQDCFKTRKLAVEVAKEISRDVDWGSLKTVKQVQENHLAMGAYQRVLGRLKLNDYGIYTGWKY